MQQGRGEQAEAAVGKRGQNRLKQRSHARPFIQKDAAESFCLSNGESFTQ